MKIAITTLAAMITMSLATVPLALAGHHEESEKKSPPVEAAPPAKKAGEPADAAAERAKEEAGKTKARKPEKGEGSDE
jgi:hypothetical protein